MAEPIQPMPSSPQQAHIQLDVPRSRNRDTVTIFPVPRNSHETSTTESSRSTFSKRKRTASGSSEEDDYTHAPLPFSPLWLAYLPVLFITTNAAGYAAIFWLLKTIEQVNAYNSLQNSTTYTEKDVPIDNKLRLLIRSYSAIASKICSALYGDQAQPSYCTSTPEAPTASADLDTPSLESSRMRIAPLSGVLAFLIGLTIALLTVDFMLHRHTLKNRPELVKEKPNDEESLEEMKASWSLANPAPAPVVKLHKTETSTTNAEDEASAAQHATVNRSFVSSIVLKVARRFSRMHTAYNGEQKSVTVLSTKRWSFSRAFLIVPVWVPLTSDIPKWEFALVQGLVGLLVGAIIHRRSRWEVKWNA